MSRFQQQHSLMLQDPTPVEYLEMWRFVPGQPLSDLNENVVPHVPCG